MFSFAQLSLAIYIFCIILRCASSTPRYQSAYLSHQPNAISEPTHAHTHTPNFLHTCAAATTTPGRHPHQEKRFLFSHRRRHLKSHLCDCAWIRSNHRESGAHADNAVHSARARAGLTFSGRKNATTPYGRCVNKILRLSARRVAATEKNTS